MIDIILTTFNRLAHLKRTVDSLLSCTDHSLIHKLIISNDGSTDGTAEYLEGLASQYSFVVLVPRSDVRAGLIPRFNSAYAMTATDPVCEIQDDILFYPGWLNAQLEAFRLHGNKVHFISGYNGEEHKVFSEIDGYKVKHSNGFVQLLAKRKVWDKWFPMKPSTPFPTPCVRNGKSIGSQIDTRIYRKKNNLHGGIRYLIVPGLIHTAHRCNSSWRPSLDKNHRFNQQKAGGLSVENSPAYWRKRGAKQGNIAVGFAGRPASEQQKIVQLKAAFIQPYLDPNLFTLDYGCGIGLFSHLFKPENYLGMDLTPAFLEVAARANPGYRYIATSPVFDGRIESPVEQFMTINVLQHNSDHAVSEIFRALAARHPEAGLRIVLYENSHDGKDSGHMRFRKPQEYVSFVAEHFPVHSVRQDSHRVHKEDHSITVIQC